jgi:hypothetical protein
MCPGLLETRFCAAYGVPAFAYGPRLLTVSPLGLVFKLSGLQGLYSNQPTKR